MKVEIKHIRTAPGPCGYYAIYVVRLPNGEEISFGGDYKSAYQFIAEAA